MLEINGKKEINGKMITPARAVKYALTQHLKSLNNDVTVIVETPVEEETVVTEEVPAPERVEGEVTETAAEPVAVEEEQPQEQTVGEAMETVSDAVSESLGAEEVAEHDLPVNDEETVHEEVDQIVEDVETEKNEYVPSEDDGLFNTVSESVTVETTTMTGYEKLIKETYPKMTDKEFERTMEQLGKIVPRVLKFLEV